jgi:2-C-methyl-D-erythritol 4-phosphate cytidylyltransferase
VTSSASQSPDLAVILAGAGEGTRMRGQGPKLLLTLGGTTLLERVARTFLAHPAVGEIVVVVPSRLEEQSLAVLSRVQNPRDTRLAVVAGGATRQESVYAGILSLQRELPYVAVHDVARALVGAELITRVLDAARDMGAAIPALPLRETVKEVDSGRVVRTVPRERLQGAQTPQIFTRDILRRAHARAMGAGATDDAWLVERMGTPVAVVPGEILNWKLTEPADALLLESHLRSGGGA